MAQRRHSGQDLVDALEANRLGSKAVPSPDEGLREVTDQFEKLNLDKKLRLAEEGLAQEGPRNEFGPQERARLKMERYDDKMKRTIRKTCVTRHNASFCEYFSKYLNTPGNLRELHHKRRGMKVIPKSMSAKFGPYGNGYGTICGQTPREMTANY